MNGLGIYWIFMLVCTLQITTTIGEQTIAPGWCSIYGECGYNPTVGNGEMRDPVPCKNNVPATEYARSSLFYERLKSTCPELIPNDNGTILACCSSSQLQTLASSLQASSLLFNRCPSCVANFKNFFCQNTCSANQSTFVNVTRFMGNKTLEYYSFWEKTTIDDFFDSCKDVIFPQTNGVAVELMCNGYSGSDCTAERWLAYVGSTNNGIAPVEVKVAMYDNTTEPPAPPPPYRAHISKMYSCSEAPDEYSSPCSCTDCKPSCPPAPPIDPTEPPFEIGEMDGVLVIAIIVFCSVTATFIVYVLACYFIMKNRPQKIDFMAPEQEFDSDEHPKISEEDVSWFEKWGKRSQDFIQNSFRVWGSFVARHPIWVIIVAAVVVGVLCVGIPMIELTTDPIQLWSSDESKVRSEKDFYDEHFGAFYRTEQVIMKLRTDLEKDEQSYTSWTGQKYQFSAILEKERLLEVLKIQNAIRYLKADFPEGNDTLGRDYVTLKDICFKPLEPDNNNCTMMSVLNYWQNDVNELDKTAYYFDDVKKINYTLDYHDHFLYCVQSPNSLQDTTELKQNCMGDYGGPVLPYVAMGGYDVGEKDYHSSIALILTFSVQNYERDTLQFKMALAWEKEFLNIIQSWNDTNFTYAYFSERSIEDEIVRQSKADLIIFAGSYLAIFLYITIALGTYTSFVRIPVDSKMTLGFAGIIVILASVAASIGFYGFIGISTSLIVVEVVPFLVLAIGADNVFILTLEFQRDKRQPGEDLEGQVGRVLGRVAPSMLLCSLTEGVVFFLGALSDMPAVQEFAYCAALAIIFDFLLQVTVFVAILKLDAQRQEDNRVDVLCCFKVKGESHTPTRLQDVFRKYYIPTLMLDLIRAIVLLGFFALFCWCIYVVSYMTVGLDQDLSVPLDSYVLNYFDYMEKYLSVGVPVYFVTKGAYNFSDPVAGNLICGSSGCDPYSMTQQISYASENPDYWEIATPATSWYDDYIDWLQPFASGSCCRREFENETIFCPSTDVETRCQSCIRVGQEPTPDQFMQYLPWFLKDNPGVYCNKGGHAAYGSAVSIEENEKGQDVVAGSSFFAYHTICIKSTDCTNNLRMARKLSENITKTLRNAPGVPEGFEVYPYCLYYVYYDQYLTMVPDTLLQIGLCLIPTFIFNFILLGFDFYSGLISIVTILMIVVDTAGICSLWGVDLNAVSLINLVAAVGLSVEFTSHVVGAFARSTAKGRKKRVVEAMSIMGPAVFAGVALTNLPGICVLAFAKSQLIQIFFFRMCLIITLLGMAHGLIFLPVFLSYFGPPVNKAILLAKQRERDMKKPPLEHGISVNKAFEMDDVNVSVEGLNTKTPTADDADDDSHDYATAL